MKKTLILLLVFSSSAILASCMLVNPVKRQPLVVTDYQGRITERNISLLTKFHPVLPGKPLEETIWDNIQGPIWDVNESSQIGYTQDYQFVPVPVPGGPTVATTVRGTRIVIPFGNAFIAKFRSATDKAFSKSVICTSAPCLPEGSPEFDVTADLFIEEFKVFESPMNHLNFHLRITLQVDAAGRRNRSEHVYTMDRFRIGSIASTSYGFIAKMNEAIDRFTEEAVEDLLPKLTPE